MRAAEARRCLEAYLFIGALAAAAAVLGVLLLPRLDGGDPWGIWAALVAAYVAAGFVTVLPDARTTVTGQSVFVVAATLLLPPELVLLMCLGQLAVETVNGCEWYKRLFNISCVAVAASAASFVATHVEAAVPVDGLALVVAGCSAALAYLALNQLVLAVMLRLADAVPLRRFPLFNREYQLAAFAIAVLGVVVAGLWQTNPWLLAVLLAPLALGIYALRMPLLRDEARLDAKTGLYNAVHFGERVRHELVRARRFDRPFALVMADLDFLREINNTHGHLAGDDVLIGVARVLRAEIRSVDLAARFGGEEFAVLLPETSQSDALDVAERLRSAVASQEFGAGLRATLSLGVAVYPDDGGTVDELLSAADRALYAAKGAGRDRVARAGTVPVLAPA